MVERGRAQSDWRSVPTLTMWSPDGKVTVPHKDFLAKFNAVRYAFIELGVDDGVIVARTDSLGAGLTQKFRSGIG